MRAALEPQLECQDSGGGLPLPVVVKGGVDNARVYGGGGEGMGARIMLSPSRALSPLKGQSRHRDLSRSAVGAPRRAAAEA